MNFCYITIIMKNKSIHIRKSFCTSLVFLITLSSFLKTDYSTYIPIDFGGYSSDTEISLILNPDNENSLPKIIAINELQNLSQNDCIQSYQNKINKFYKLKLNRYIFPQILPIQYLNQHFLRSNQIIRKFNICHKSTDDSDPFMI